jgi:tripartite-type tricarboxylate transporter receptor subunit TctC
VTKWLSLVPVFSIFASVTCVFFDARLAFAVVAKSAVAKPSDTIDLLVGFRPGAAYDLYARLTARMNKLMGK